MDGTQGPSKWLTLAAVCLGLGMLMIDTFVVNVALPAIGRNLDASLSATEWVVTGYVLVLGVFPVAMGRLGDIFGRRRIYIAGLAVFVASSLACGLAPNIEMLILGRVVQGLGAATMMPLTLSIITNAFPAEQRGLAIGTWGGVSGLGLLAGPILGGLLVDGDNWRWIFLVNLPVGAIAVAAAMLFVAESRDESTPRRVDVTGLAVLTAMLLLFILAINRGNHLGWGSPQIVGSFALAAVLLPVFIAVERRVRAPLVDLSLFRSGSFVAACASALLFSAAVFGSQPFTSLLMQNTWGFTPLEGGLAFIPATAIVALLMPVSGIMAQRLGSRMRLLIIAGSLLVLASFVLLLRITTASGYVDGLLGPFLLRGLGIGLVMSAASYAAVTSAPLAKSGLAAGTLTMSRQLGTSIGVAIFGAVFVHSVAGGLPPELETLPPAEAAAIAEQAERFNPGTDPALAEPLEQTIIDGFVVISAVGVGIAALAAATAWLIRMREPARPGVPAATEAAANPVVTAPAPPEPRKGQGTPGR
ncbi:MAG: MFS transporter [Dehalococcoidia bacterium]|nr:MFS transporter [Dehalococcoidia bacterium]